MIDSCPLDHKLSNLTSKEVMEKNGWEFSSTMQHNPVKYHNNCTSESVWYGKAMSCEAFAKVTFRGRGKVLLKYINCNPDTIHPSRSTVSLLQPDDLEEGIINESRGKAIESIYNFSREKYIKFSLDCNAVVRIISLQFICKNELLN